MYGHKPLHTLKQVYNEYDCFLVIIKLIAAYGKAAILNPVKSKKIIH